MLSDDITWMAQLTPRGTGAIAVIAVGGPDAAAILARLFRGPWGRPVAIGPFGEGPGDTVVLVQSDGRFEVHCHGGPAVTRWILDQLRQAGVREISWREWTRRQFPRPVQAAAAEALAEALTLRTAAILLDQFHGALEQTVVGIVADLESGRLDSVRAAVAELLERAEVGLHLTKPWRVVLTGRPNVGKSSLINALLGYQRAITSPIPGTTRDVLTSLTAFDGWPVELVDTAGIHDATDTLESEGIRRAVQTRSSADLVVLVLDCTCPEPPDLRLEGEAESGTPKLIVANKADLPAVWHPPGFPVSALTGEGLPALMQAIVAQLVPHPPPAGAAVPFLESHRLTLHEAWQCVNQMPPDVSRAADLLRSLITKTSA